MVNEQVIPPAAASDYAGGMCRRRHLRFSRETEYSYRLEKRTDMSTQPYSLRIRTKVLPGHRIEVSDPALQEGDTVEIQIAGVFGPPRRSLLDICRDFPEGPRSASTWEEIESNLRAERDAWDD